MLTRRALAVLALVSVVAVPGLAQAQTKKVRIGQATPAVSFLPIMAARALDGFKADGIDLEWAAIPGGDPTALAALDSGDIDLAAVGSETVLNAVTHGQPFQIVGSLMSKVSLELVVSNAFLERTGVSPADPLPKRLAALKGAVIGVSAIGGTQDRAARWLAVQGGLARTDIQVAMVGAPTAIQAALENKRIDAYVLSPPEGLFTEDAKTGKVLVRIGDEFPKLKGVPSLVLVAKTPVDAAKKDLIVATLRVLKKASAAVTADSKAVAATLQQKLFARIKPEIMTAAVDSLKDGVADGGKLSVAGIDAMLRFAEEAGSDAGKGLEAAKGENAFWTNTYIDAAN